MICPDLNQFDKARIICLREALFDFERDGNWIATFVTRMLCETDAFLQAA
ncbi:hypothetical protein SAMN02927924_01949 [Sphingobium faniae]|nr:hypothetical protein SAMN02927924_01949 [Sphingobium faniae]